MKFCLLPKTNTFGPCRAHSSLSSSQKKRVLSWFITVHAHCLAPGFSHPVSKQTQEEKKQNPKLNTYDSQFCVSIWLDHRVSRHLVKLYSGCVCEDTLVSGPVASSLLSLPPTPCLGAPVLAQAPVPPQKLHYFPWVPCLHSHQTHDSYKELKGPNQTMLFAWIKTFSVFPSPVRWSRSYSHDRQIRTEHPPGSWPLPVPPSFMLHLCFRHTALPCMFTTWLPDTFVCRIIMTTLSTASTPSYRFEVKWMLWPGNDLLCARHLHLC